MRTDLARLALGALGGFGALGLLHREPWPLAALGCGVAAVLAGRALRSTWGPLPGFVVGWLDAGVAVTTGIIAGAVTGTTRGWPYLLLRWPELLALGCAASLASLLVAALAHTASRLAREVAAETERAALSQQRALESRLSALSAQINPHFLFNVLNTLAEVVHEDEDRAEDLITDLAALMRHALRGTTARVALREELDAVTRVLRLEGARLGARLRWTMDVDPSTLDEPIPALLVQPLVENAVRHGVAGKVEGGLVTVGIRREEGDVVIEVTDDGVGLGAEAALALLPDAPPTEGTGLRNVAERTRLSWPTGTAGLSRAPSEQGTRLVLRFPARVT